MNAAAADESFTILIVDDEDHVIQGLSRVLKARGHRVLGATNGRQALKAARNERPDFVLLDIVLGDEDGLEVCLLLRQLPQRPIVITMSGKPPKDVLLDALVAGAVDHLLKPIDVAVLVQRMKNHMENRRGGSLPPPQALPIQMDKGRFVLVATGKAFSLTGKRRALVQLLLANCDRVVSLAQIQYELELASEKSARELIRNTRRALGDQDKQLIETVRSDGYIIRSLAPDRE